MRMTKNMAMARSVHSSMNRGQAEAGPGTVFLRLADFSRNRVSGTVSLAEKLCLAGFGGEKTQPPNTKTPCIFNDSSIMAAEQLRLQ